MNGYLRRILPQFFLFFQFTCFAQTDSTKLLFNHLVMEVQGDLNHDGIDDKVIVTQDTLHEMAPYRFQVFFVDKDGFSKLIVTTSKLIEPQYPNGREGYQKGNGFSDVTIQKGVLRVNNVLLRGNFSHTFRFQHGNFELIGFSETYSDGNGVLTTIDFNLSTGVRIVKLERCDTNKQIRKSKKKIIIRTLPKLQDLIPFDNELY